MSSRKVSTSILLIHLVTNVIFWIITFFIVILLIIAFGLISNLYAQNITVYINIPQLIDYTESATLSLGNISTDIIIQAKAAKIGFNNAPYIINIIIGIILIIGSALFFNLITLFKRFTTNVKDGIIFEKQNAQLLKKISVGMFYIWLFSFIGSITTYFLILKNITPYSIGFSFGFYSFYNWLLASLFFWVLSQIFSQGIKLQEESSLTI